MILTPQELKNFEEAVEVLQNRSAADTNDQTGYDYQARLHNVGRSHPDNSFGACEHDSEEFLPWHRAHLHLFEKLLQSANANSSEVTIPYWDWTKPSSGQRLPAAFEDPSSPLFHVGRWPAGSGAPIPTWDGQLIKNLVAEPDWNIFAGDAKTAPSTGTLESGAHNSLHGWIGPTMGSSSTASEDPVYWVFHAFIDLIWARWQKRRTQIYQDGSAKLWLEPDDFMVSQMTETTQFGYEYDYDFSTDEPTPLLVLAGETNLNAREVGQRALVTAPTGGTVIIESMSKRTFLRLDGVQTFPDLSYQIQVYLHPADLNLDALPAGEEKRYLVEKRTLWNRHDSPAEHNSSHGRTKLFIEITKDLISLNTPDWRATVRAEALPLVAPSSESMRSAKETGNVRFNELSSVIENIVVETR